MLFHLHGDLHGQQAEEGGELDDGIHRHGAGVLERVAHGVAHDRGGVQGRAFLFEVHLDNFLGVVPRAAGVGHEDGLKQAEEGDGDQVGDEEVRVEKGQAERQGEDDDEDVDHAFLRVDGADFHDLFGVGERGGGGVQFDVVLNEDNSPISAGDDRLGAGAGEPIDDRAAHEQAEDDRRLHEAELGDDIAKGLLQQHDDAEDHGGGAHDGGADEDGFGGGLEGVAGPVAFFQLALGIGEIGFERELFFNFTGNVREGFNAAQFINGLGVVGDRAEAVHGDGHRSHGEKAEGHQAEGEDGGVERGHERQQVGVLGKAIRREHEGQNHQAHPEGGKVAGDQAGQHVERSTAMVGGVGDFAHMPRTGADENLGELHDQRAGEGAAGDNGGEHPPEVCEGDIHEDAVHHFGNGEAAEQPVGGGKTDQNGDDGGDPNQIGERALPVEIFPPLIARPADDFIQVERAERGEHHEALDGEEPEDEFAAEQGRIGKGQRQKGDERDAGDAVSLETVGGRADGITGVVAGAIGNDAGVFGIILGQVEHDFHEVGPDVGDLGEDAAADAEDRGAEGFADGKTDEAGARQHGRHKGQDADHAGEFHADEQQADAHAGLQRDKQGAEGVAAQRGEGGAAVGGGVDADAEPGDGVTAENAEH